MAAGDLPVPGTLPTVIGVRGARHHNLADLDEVEAERRDLADQPCRAITRQGG
jgi:hypothetical protein